MPKEIPSREELLAKYKELGSDRKKLVIHLYDTGLTKTQIIRALDSNKMYVDAVILAHNKYIASQYNPLPPKEELNIKLKELGSVANLCRWLYDLGCSNKDIYKATKYSPSLIKKVVDRRPKYDGIPEVKEDIEELRKTYEKDTELIRYLFKKGYSRRAIHNATGITLLNVRVTITRFLKVGDPKGYNPQTLGTKKVVPELVIDYVYARYRSKHNRVRHLHLLDYTNNAIAEALDLWPGDVQTTVSRFRSGTVDPELNSEPSLPIDLGDMQFIGSPLAG